MKALPLLFFFLSLGSITAQNDFLAKQYLNNGDFEKAIFFYKKLVENNPQRTDFAEELITCYQQLERYTDVEEFLNKKITQNSIYPTFFIELGYNYALQNKPEKATKEYDKALAVIDKYPNYGYTIGSKFQKYALLNYALKAYSKAMQLNSKLNYSIQLARIYGEQGNIEKMFISYLNLLKEEKTSMANVISNINAFISANAEDENNNILKTILLKNAQANPNIQWNELLSWLFVKQKQYRSAFRQEKAIYNRTEDSSIERLENLAKIALEANEIDVAQSIFEYIFENVTSEIDQLNAQLQLIDIELIGANQKEFTSIEKHYNKLVETHGYKSQTIQLQIAYANFLTFKKDNANLAEIILKKSLELPLNIYKAAYVKLALGDILVFNKKFNEALIYFTQVQKKLKNDILGHNARYKIAQTSFYKGDFDWAYTQLKVLRGSTSQLIANDAMQLSLLISDNSLEDSTQTALKKYAVADLLAYQNKTKKAIATLDDILENHKGEKIEDEALLKQGELLENQKAYAQAKFNYQKIIEFYASGILADDAHYALGELYRKILNEPEKAKVQYEKIIYNYQDSYYFPKARKQYRKLRGDTIN